jgi:hypothetical protein
VCGFCAARDMQWVVRESELRRIAREAVGGGGATAGAPAGYEEGMRVAAGGASGGGGEAQVRVSGDGVESRVVWCVQG